MHRVLLYGYFYGFLTGASFSYLCTKSYIYTKNVVIPKDKWPIKKEDK